MSFKRGFTLFNLFSFPGSCSAFHEFLVPIQDLKTAHEKYALMLFDIFKDLVVIATPMGNAGDIGVRADRQDFGPLLSFGV
jgi:hypothetical protein